MDPLERMADAKIREAQEAGLFDDLPGKGKPLELEDLSRVPPELRAGYSLLKGAGVLPEELELRQSTMRLADLLAACEADDPEAQRLRRELRTASLRVELMAEKRKGLGAGARDYSAALLRRLR